MSFTVEGQIKANAIFSYLQLLTMGNPMRITFFILGMQKGGFWRFEKGHFFKKPRDGRGVELAKS